MNKIPAPSPAKPRKENPLPKVTQVEERDIVKMSYRGSRVLSVDSFDGYDPTPYSGGFDLSLTYGRPLQPSDEICYPVSGPHTSVFKTGNAQKSDCCGLLRPGFQLQPQPVSNTGYPSYGHQSYGHRGGGGGASDYGSGYGGCPQFQDYGSTYGQGCHHPQHQEFRSEYGSGYESGRKPQYGYEYGREGSKHHGDEGYGASGYGRREEEGYGRQGFGGNEYRRSEEEVGGEGRHRKNNDYVYGGNTSYVRPSHGVGEEENAKFRSYGYGEKGSGGYKNSSYGDEYQSTGYRKPSYYAGEEGEGNGPSKYVRSLLLSLLFNLHLFT